MYHALQYGILTLGPSEDGKSPCKENAVIEVTFLQQATYTSIERKEFFNRVSTRFESHRCSATKGYCVLFIFVLMRP